jgi:large repetitive protein
MADDSQIPEIRVFQFDSGAIGDLSGSVNLFRGDINLSQQLLVMPGRVQGDGLDVNVALLYQSNVYRDATTWNRDAPTSIVGLGWTLPGTYIRLNEGQAITAGARTYTYVSNATPNPLAREPQTPFLFSMDSALASQLQNGQLVPSAVRAGFVDLGINLSASATVQTVSATSWMLADDDNQQLFNLVLSGAELQAYDGGESYQLFNYSFWKILYYPVYERWVITNESGQRTSFGGLGPTDGQGPKTSVGNSIEWAVQWTPDGGAVWTGPSELITGQSQYARVWHLVSASSVWGDSIQYSYDAVEQLVGGSAGMPYTKALYLGSITDVFGRKAVFQYVDKVWSDDTPESPREYADPHQATPGTDPNAYQDRYETLALQSVTVQAPTGATLFSLELVYQPTKPAGGPGSPVANVTSFTGSLYGDTCKRILTGVTMSNAEGDTLPGLVFDYYFTSTGTGVSPGALKSITWPQGGVATYTYTQQTLDVCDRTYQVSPPSSAFTGAIPRVFFGDDYAVTCWYNPAKGMLSLQVYTWLGRWAPWSLTADAVLFSDTDGLDLSTLNVVASEDFFALSFQRVSEVDVYVFQKDAARPGQWVPATVNETTTAPNVPTRSYPRTSGTVSLVGGDAFLLVTAMDTTDQKYSYDRLTWRWTTGTWTLESSTLANFTWATASNEYHLFLDHEGNVSLWYLAPTLEWMGPTTTTLQGFSVVNDASIALAPSGSFVVVSNLKLQSRQSLTYQLTFLQWDAVYALPAAPTSFSFTDAQEPSGQYPTTWIPQVVSNELVGVAAHLLRYNGQVWLVNSNLKSPYTPLSGLQQRYAYGPDYAIQILVPNRGLGIPTAKVLSFDPDADSASWTRTPVTPAQALSAPRVHANTANWPSSGGEDYLTIGQYLYFRGTATDWDGVVAQPPTADLQAVVNQALGSDDYLLNAESVVDEGPAFQAYYVYDTSDPTKDLAAAVVLQNGGVSGQAETLTSQRIYTEAESGAPTPGEAPGGPSAFAAYPATDQDFDHASAILLHRYAGDSIEDPLMHYAVTGLSITDGYGGSSPTTYFPDPSQAACDPTGLVVKYYAVTTYPGTADATQPTYGWKVTNYLNGLEVLTGADYYNMLDGLLHSESVYDSQGTLLSQSVRGWTVYVARASDPTDGSQPTLNLKGGFVCQTSQATTEDGVTGTQTTSYLPPDFQAPFSGQPVSVQNGGYGGSGQPETFSSLTTYAYEVNDAALALHMLSLPAQNSTLWASGTGTAVPVKATATTYTGFPSVWGADVLVPGVEGSFSWLGTAALGFPFESYAPGGAPAGWQVAVRTIGRDVSGQVTETLDGCGVAQSTLYSADRSLPVARVTNASTLGGAWAYLGFESYESAGGWALQSTQVVLGDAHTGSNSLALPGGQSASLTTGVTPPNEDQTYLLGYWYKTPAGYTSVDGAGFTVTVSVDGSVTATLTSQFQDSGGTWAYATLGIPLTAGQSSIALSIQAANASADTVLVDDVLVVPLVSKLVVRAYDPTYRLVLSAMDSTGRTLRTVYDDFQRQSATVGPQEQVKQIVQLFQSREGNAGGAFDPGSPNAALTVQPATGGSLETFTTGNEWQSRWQASNAATNWSTSGGALSHTSSTADTLAWIAFPDGAPATCAVFFEVQPQATLSGALGVSFGGGYQISYDPSTGYAFTDPDGNPVQAPLAAPPTLQRQWLIVFGQGVVLCLGDGQLLFSASLSLSDLGTVAFFTGPNVLSLRNLAMVTDPRVVLTQQDATGQDRQNHHLWGDDARVSALIHDALGRTVAVTRMAPASYGDDASLPLLAYRPSFVDVTAFLAAMANTWQMTGDVADYYQGQSDGPVNRSNDGGYPYYGYRYEASSRARRLEEGQPGQAYAIHDVNSTTPSERQTTQFAYGSYTGSEFNLPDGDYRTDAMVTPTKLTTTSLNDTLGRKIASLFQDSTSAVVGQGQAVTTFAGTGGSGAANTMVKNQPNTFTTSPQSDPADYVSSATQNPLGLQVQSTDPDTNTSLFLYDPSGRLRFAQPQMDPSEAWFAYYKYDALGRVLEEGTVNQAWDAAQLPAYAAQPDWPGDDVSHTVSRTHAYDGDGADPDVIGKEVQVVTVNPAPASVPLGGTVTVTETYGYDGGGNLDEVTLKVASSSGTPSGTIGYTYNNLQEITQVTYPDGAPLSTVIYQYNDQAQVTAIGSSASTPSDLAAYTYTVDGDVETEVRNAGTLTGTYEYASPGWLLQYSVLVGSSQTPSFQLTYGYNPDGTIGGRTRTYAFPAVSQTTQVTYAYDGRLRLQSATVAEGQPGNEAVDQYDANGNIWKLTQDGTPYAFTCAAGANRLSTMSVGVAPSTPLTYGADGRLLQMSNLALAYDPYLKLTTGLVTSGDSSVQVRLAYGGKGQRVLRQSSSQSFPAVYFRGVSQQPLCTQVNGVWTAAYVLGPTGLIAAVGEARTFPLKDTVHTVWAAVDDGNALIAQYDYLPFGLQISATGPQPDALPFRFMGQELDPDTGLYDFGARLYHPVLRRFCSADVARQFASPYLFGADNPLSMVDPSGNITTWGRVGIGVGMGVLAGVGFALSFFSFGLSDVIAGVLESMGTAVQAASQLLGDEAFSAIQTALSVTRTALNATRTAVQASAKVINVIGNFAHQVVTNTAFGVGASGFQYDVTAGPNRDFTRAGFRQALASGAFSGMLYGVGSGLLGLECVVESIKSITSFAWRTVIRVGSNTILGTATNEVAQILTNVVYHQPWYQGWGVGLGVGALEGVPFGLGDVIKNDRQVITEGFQNMGRSIRQGGTDAAQALATAKQHVVDASNRVYQSLFSEFQPIPEGLE